MFVIALVVTLVVYPLYERFCRWVGNKMFASVITTLFLVVVVFVPIYLFFLVSVGQAIGLIESIDAGLKENPQSLLQLQTFVGEGLSWLDLENLSTLVVSSTLTFVRDAIVPLTATTVTFIMNLTFFVMFLIYLFPAKNTFFASLKRILPFTQADSDRFVDRFEGSAGVVMKSIIVGAAAQSLTAAVAYFFLGIPALGFWIFAMFFASFLPLGSGLITVPIAIILLLTGNVWGGLFLIGWHTVVVSSVDNVVRAKMFKGGVINMPELITFITTLGGLVIFGFFGVIYGPLIAVAFLALLDIYREKKELLERGIAETPDLQNQPSLQESGSRI